MFAELEAELAKMQASVESAFVDASARVAAERARVTNIDAGLLAGFDRVTGLAAQAESTVKGRLTDLRSVVDGLTK